MQKTISQKTQSCELYVEGMYCAACEVILEKELKKTTSSRTNVTADLKSGKITITSQADTPNLPPIEDLTKLIASHGYKAQATPFTKASSFDQWFYAVPIATMLILLYLILQKSGVIKTDLADKTYLQFFITGIMASLSSCMAMTGGLVLSLSSKFSQEPKWSDRLKPQILFHISRLIGFFSLGILVGIAGSSFSIKHVASFFYALMFSYMTTVLIKSKKFSKYVVLGVFLVTYLVVQKATELQSRALLSILAGGVLLSFGLNLLNLFKFTKRFQVALPKFFGKKILELKDLNHKFTPIFLGLATFFLPCGFTQSVQLYAFTRPALQSGLILLAFALGTFPVLSLISIGNLKFSKSLNSPIFYKVSGLIILFFAIINILEGLVLAGYLNNGLSFLY